MKAQARPPGGRDEVSAGTHERLGPYRVIHRIGEGGMGVVHLGLDRQGRAVAIKVLRPHIAYDPDARSRLEREVETLSRITDHRVAAVLDADIFGERPYIVTRYVAGPSLDEVVAERGALSGDELLRLGRGLVGALDAIHAVGVIHRDLKPGNLLIEDGEPVVIDFGIAHVADDIRLTSAGLVMGTPGYLSPELVEGAGVTEATDWWGWAATLAFAASGRPPFGRGPMDVVLDRVRRGDTDLTGVDPRLTPLLQAALCPDPRRRPPARQVVAALERYAVGEPATVVLPGDLETTRHGSAWSRVSADPTPRHTEPAGVRHTSVLPQTEPWVDGGNGNGNGNGNGSWDDPTHSDGQAVAEWEESDWQAAWEAGPSDPDPRIGRPMRTGTLAGLAAAFAGAAAHWPLITVSAVIAWCWVARFSDRSVTSLVMRRFNRGRRRSDVPMAVVLSPWHVVTSGVSTVASLLLPTVVAVSAAFSAVLGISSLSALEPGAAAAPALAVGFGAGLLVAWWGPGGASLRRGSRSVVRGLVPRGTATTVVVAVLLAAALALAVLAVAAHGHVSWWPLSGDPGAALRGPQR
jgi:serine/threonine protein kinase